MSLCVTSAEFHFYHIFCLANCDLSRLLFEFSSISKECKENTASISKNFIVCCTLWDFKSNSDLEWHPLGISQRQNATFGNFDH
jgi:hypothetical protein